MTKSPEIKVAHFEDESANRESLANYLLALSGGSVEVVSEASRLEEALERIVDIKQGELNVDVIVCDGEGFIVDVLECMQIHDVNIPVIGASGYDMSHFGVEDKVVRDAGKDASKILEAINEIFELAPENYT